MKGFFILAILTLVHPHRNYAFFVLQGPEVPVEEGDYVTLECQSDMDSNMTQVHFERFSKHLQKWFRLEAYGSIQTYMEGPYRCVSDEAASPYNSSLPLYIPVHYMREISVYREGVKTYSRYFSQLQDLRVPLGDDVELVCSASASEEAEITWYKEGEDWILPRSKLELNNVRKEAGGTYTCTAQHPSIPSLKKTRTITVTVLPEDAPWYDSTEGRLTLMISAAGVGVLLLIMSVSICLCRRASGRKSKGPIDDHSQKKPIYKTSTESLLSTTGDKQPLV
ncbi:hypothetical protein SKAU_G00417520 [Synaphobranchus kaupii]|uniref:Ig-like domain-containing protein n=1 Tax=Synaphobranchus kaupii TaxID=118154 RepID=A0A9Q1E5Z1_SYNKA|nr:hypothetical protein SKAU_G00417520 [Synaphobranchus kaupii]